MKSRLLRLLMTIPLAGLVGCSPSATPTAVPPTGTPARPTATVPLPTLPQVPVATLIPPVETPTPATGTVCTSGCNFTTIQAAIDDASTANGAIIEVTDPVHTEAGIVVSKDVIIRGVGAGNTIVQAHETVDQAPERVFLIEEGATAIVQDLIIRHGKVSVEGEHGGGIMNDGTLTVKDCVVTHNIASGGGGIANNGSLTVINSTISHNTAHDIAPPGLKCSSGGGILSRLGELRVINSTIHGNQAGLRSRGTGGGLRIGCKCNALIANTTISGNQSLRYGAGLTLMGTLRLINCTICSNQTKDQAAGIYIRGRLDMENTIIANNRGPGNECVILGPDARSPKRGVLGSNTNNWVADDSCSPDFSGDPILGPLDDNGGDTWTHALLPGSPAIDAVAPDDCRLPIDQRGAPRPVAQISTDTPCDIGAFEAQP